MTLRDKLMALNRAGISFHHIATRIGVSERGLHAFKTGFNKSMNYESGAKLDKFYREYFNK